MNLALLVTSASHVSFLITNRGVSILLWWPWAFCLPMLAHPGSPTPEPGSCMGRLFFLELRPLMRSSWHSMSLQSQLANSWDQTKSLLSEEGSKESVLTSQRLPPHPRHCVHPRQKMPRVNPGRTNMFQNLWMSKESKEVLVPNGPHFCFSWGRGIDIDVTPY